MSEQAPQQEHDVDQARPLAEELADIRAAMQEIVAERQTLAGVLNAMNDALQAMAEQLDALTEALAGEEGDGDLQSLDGTFEGHERDPLDVL